MKATASVRDGKEEKKVAYVVRREPEVENVINPKRKKLVNQRSSLFEIAGHTSSENPSMHADV